MSPLLKIRAERDHMSAIERRIADFLLENAHLLRDYSSQQLANALGISQSSVVKFSQKLGFKGYPDLKFSIGQSVARGDNGDDAALAAREPMHGDPHAALAERLWQAKSSAEQETRLINRPERVDAIAALLARAGKVFVLGHGGDGFAAQAFATRLSLLGIVAVPHVDSALLLAGIASAERDDVLMLFSEHGRQTALCRAARAFHERHGRVVTVTRHSANPLRAHGDHALLVSAHDDRAQIEPLLYQAALQQLLDLLFLVLCEDDARRHRLEANLEHLHSLHEP